MLIKEGSFIYKISGAIMRGILWLGIHIGYRPKVIYENKKTKKLLKKQAVIFAPNHFDYKDGPVCYFLFKNSSIMIAKDWYENKAIRWVTYGKDAIPLDRYGLDTGWLRHAVKMVKDNKNVIIFPEGYTSDNKEIDKFKAGFAMLSVMTGAPIVPMYIDGEYNPFLGKRLRIYVGDIEYLSEENKGMSSEYLEKECQRIRDIVLGLQEKSRKG